jgi:hypothetical protein
MSAGALRAIDGGLTAIARPHYGERRKPLGDPAPLACTVAKTAVEAILGGDGLDTLARWVATDVRESLQIQQSLARRAGLRGAVAHIERARVCRVSQRAAEVSIVAIAAGRARAVAMRFEDISGRWLATVVEIV